MIACTVYINTTYFYILEIKGGEVLPNAADICASFQYFILQHLAKRIQRAFLFCDLNSILPEHNRTLVCMNTLYRE